MRPYFQRGLRMNYEKGYYSNGNVQYDAAKELLTLIPTNPRSLLDIGCGSGKVSHLIYQKVSPKQMLSIDISHNKVSIGYSILL